MSNNLISIKNFLGKYYPEISYSAIQEKYNNTELIKFFDQRFYIQNNKTQMIVDESLNGLIVNVVGNEIHISKKLYDHPFVQIVNTIENKDQILNPRNLYNKDVFSTLAYLVCQNHTMFRINGDIDEPIYVNHKSDFETFYNSVIVIETLSDISLNVIEEFESRGALNSVINYILHPRSDINLTTFYNNRISGLSFNFRNIILEDNSKFNHMLFGIASSNIIDENKLIAGSLSRSTFNGIVKSEGRNFHSILYVHPTSEDYNINVDYRNILSGNSNVTFLPVILGQEPINGTSLTVSNISLDEIPEDDIDDEIKKYINDIVDTADIKNINGVERFYNNKLKFLNFQ